ncbi:PEP/pyruvate-binding domain-containing protein [Candidatus Viridilinea mediisalina]|uniref:Phosphoenolpyruvate synthase n=1 Tax=Candidatus Viridilinea mediisalina TaxID=2024553 RepID=A0A2A6REX0_9CHLR|nr:PEP/pyruvate-binding domain-containing protein [Candidatus Viridilinea mediisalina]PDW01356.1 hypothetical protein CJ255_19325 [Candidatus Viridilinea mediisalina]
MIRTLADLHIHDLAHAGGKGARLGAMVGAGLPVPAGFVVLTDAYRLFVETHGLHAAIHALRATASLERMDALTGAAHALQQRFLAAELPAALRSVIVQAYEALGAGPVAVRSSATAEDLPDASFAGQHDSYLYIDGPDALCDAVLRCWASLWNPRAVAYRCQQDLHLDDVALAVVVQRMVPAERAGVLFTAHPINHCRDQMLLSASWGLGEAVVSGEVSPDQWVVEGRSGAILETHVALKEVMTVRAASGTTTHPMPEELRAVPALSAQEVAQVVELGRRAAAFFGSPQDVEWAWAEGQAYLVQSRPITSLFPLPEPLPEPHDGLRLYLCLTLHAQQMCQPLTPSGIEWWRALVASITTATTGKAQPAMPWFKVGAGRIFVDTTALLRTAEAWQQLGTALADKDAITSVALMELQQRIGPAIINQGPGLQMGLPMLSLGMRLAWRALLAALGPDQERKRVVAETDQALEELECAAAQLSGVTARIDFIEHVLARQGAMVWLVPVAVIIPALMAEQELKRRVEQWFGDLELFRPIQRALPYNPTTEMGLELWRLAQRFKAEGLEPHGDHPAIKRFLLRYGHRALWEIDPGMARWDEQPDYILSVLRRYMDQTDARDQVQQFHAHEKAARAAADALVARVAQQQGRRAAWFVRQLLRIYRQLGGVREQPKFDGSRMIALARRILQQVGAELVARGQLAEVNDVFFLSFAELRAAERQPAANDLRQQVAAAQRAYQQEQQRRAVPRWMTSNGECIFGVSSSNVEGQLSGIPVSAGTYTGQVRIVHDPTSTTLAPGEILVCRGTDPAWTPLFLSAGALIMETGGAVSHGSVVAREYGLPAVAGVAGATTRLHDGQWVRVNGATGHVELLEHKAA